MSAHISLMKASAWLSLNSEEQVCILHTKGGGGQVVRNEYYLYKIYPMNYNFF